jgi:excisionase family DNA binding protein
MFRLEKLLDAKTVAELLGEKERWVYQQAKAKKIPSVKLGKYWRFSPSQLQKWLAAEANPLTRLCYHAIKAA